MGHPNKILLKVLTGEKTWPPPIWLMRQAGRHLPEFRKLRRKFDFMTRCLTPELIEEITLQPIQRYGMDGAILFSDILILPWSMGLHLEFNTTKGPVIDVVKSEKDLAALDFSAIEERVQPILETLRRLSKYFSHGKNVPTLIGFAGSPFTVACYMIEGGSSREYVLTRQTMYEREPFFNSLIEILIKQTSRYLCWQIKAGAEVVMLFDSWCGLLSPQQFRKYVIGPTTKIVENVKNHYPDTPIIGFPRLGSIMMDEYAIQTGINAVGLDTNMDAEYVKEKIPLTIVTQGHLDPVILKVGNNLLKQNVIQMANSYRFRPHIFNLGHGVLPDTRPEHVSQLVETLRSL